MNPGWTPLVPAPALSFPGSAIPLPGSLVQPQLHHNCTTSKPNSELVAIRANESFNLNSLFKTQIQSYSYFQQLVTDYLTFQSILDVIIQEADHLQPFEKGKGNFPSVSFCCLYRFFQLKLNKDQMNILLKHKSPYVRGIGFLYLRCVGALTKLLTWIEPYITDSERFSPTYDKKKLITMGEYIHNLFNDIKYYGTVLRRIPATILRDLERTVLELQIKKERVETNRRRIKKGLKCKARWTDGRNYPCIIEEIQKNGNFLVTYTEYQNQEEVKIEDLEIDFSQLDRRRRSNSRGRSKRRSRSRNRSRGRNRRSDDRSRDRRRKSRSRERNRYRGRRTRRSRSRSRSRRKKELSVEDEIKLRQKERRKQERENAVSKGGVYARLPTGYKRSLGETVETVDRPRFQPK